MMQSFVEKQYNGYIQWYIAKRSLLNTLAISMVGHVLSNRCQTADICSFILR